jgi:hypothetical protein
MENTSLEAVVLMRRRVAASIVQGGSSPEVTHYLTQRIIDTIWFNRLIDFPRAIKAVITG